MLSGDAATFLGHSTTLIESAGSRLLTDPVLRERLAHLRRHAPPVAEEATQDLDAILISHLHHDHFDKGSLRRLDRATPVVVPAGGGELAAGLGFRDIREVTVGDELSFGRCTVTAVEADHDGGRGPRSRHRAEPVGYVVRGERAIYFAGDTDRFGGMTSIGEMGLDLALLPVWGWGPSVGSGHLDPESAAEALTLLRPKVAVPIHWGTLFPLVMHRVRPDALHDPPRIFARCAGRIAPATKVEILEPGSRIEMG